MLFPGPHSLLANEASSYKRPFVKCYNRRTRGRFGRVAEAEPKLHSMTDSTPKMENGRFDSQRVDCQVSHRRPRPYSALAM